MKARTALSIAAMAGLCAAAAPAPAAIAPGGFSATVDNPWYPLEPGTTFRYRGVKDGKPTLDVYRVTHRTAIINGAPCVVVSDRLYEAGRLAEETTDWYSQDRQGTVWYFGEATRELDRRGHTVSTEGSWRAGLDGASEGIFMPAHPRTGDSFAQEHYRGHAEDHFKVVSLHSSISVPFGRFHRRAMLTREWTPLEPGVIDHKYYVRGVGEVAEISAKGPRETGRLVSLTRP